jgi:biopolymer transport protein ExbD
MLQERIADPDDSLEQYVDAIDDRPLVTRRPMDDSEMDITPMIDITFLLLIFFLVAARLDQDAPVELPPARHGTAVSVKSSVIITMAQGSGESADVYTGDGKAAERLLDAGELEAQSAAITQYVEEELANGKENVLIKAEKGVRHRDVARVSRAVGQAGKDLYVAVLEVP